MATYFVASGGSNTAPYDTWAKAATSLQTALTAATTAGDVVVIQYNAVPAADAELAADTVFTFGGHVSLVSASNDGGSAYTLTAMGTGNWIGNSTTNRYVRLQGSDLRALVWGLTLRCAGSTLDTITPAASGSGGHFELNNCLLWHSGTATGSVIQLATGTTFLDMVDCTFRFGAVGQYIESPANVVLRNCSVSSSGSAPTALFFGGTSAGVVTCIGCDFSHVTGTLVGNTGADFRIVMDRCKLGAGVTKLASQTSNPTRASASLTLRDCHSGDTHGFFGYYDALGSVELDTSIYVTTSDAGAASWKIVTTANANYRTPFYAPWVHLYHTGTSAITPRFEILRDGSATAYTDAEVWGEFVAKTNSGFVNPTFASDKQSVAAYVAGTAGTNQAAGAGTGSWTGEGGTAWSGKVDSGSSMTPAESGYLSGRVVVAAASATVYVEPVIRTA